MLAAQSVTPTDDAADAVFEMLEHEFELLEDGSTVYRYSHRLKHITYYSFSRAYGESFIVYNPEWQELNVTKSLTTMRSGRKVESPFNAYNEVLPRYAAAAAPHLGLREMVVTHTGLETGSVVEFSYTITTSKGMFPGLMGKVVFGERSPIRSLVVRVIVPEGTELRSGMARDNLTPSIERRNGKRIHTWIRENIALVEVEAFQPPLEQIAPVLYFSTATYEDIVRHCLADPALMTLPTDAHDIAKSLAADSLSVQERAAALRGWTNERVARMPGPLDIVGYSPRSARATFDQRVGSDLDRAVLLAAMCRAAGIEALPVLISDDMHPSGWQMDSEPTSGGTSLTVSAALEPDVPSLHLFPRAAVQCRNPGRNGSTFLLSPGSTQTGLYPPEFAGKAILPLDPAAAKPQRYTPPFKSTTVSLTSVWKIQQDGTIQGKSRAVLDGMRSCSLDRPAMQRMLRQSVGRAGQGMKVTPGDVNVDADGTSACEADVVSEKVLAPIASYASFALPVAPGGISEMNLVAGDVRRTSPLQLQAALREENRLTLHLNGNVHLAGGSRSAELKNSVGTVTSNIRADKHDIEVTRIIDIDVDIISPQAYEDFRALMRIWNDPAHTSLLLRVDE